MAENHYEDKEMLFRYLRSIRVSGEYLLQTINRAMDAASQDAGIGCVADSDNKGKGLEDYLQERRQSNQNYY